MISMPENYLRVGDKVWWKGGFGKDSEKLVKVESIEKIPGPWKKEGKNVDKMKWSTVVGDKALVTMDNGHWAYGSQLREYEGAPEELEIIPEGDYLNVGDKVMWRGDFGQGDPKPAKVEGIEILDTDEDYFNKEGREVDRVLWSDSEETIIQLDTGNWCYGEQISKYAEAYSAPGRGTIIGIVSGVGILIVAGIATAVILKKKKTTAGTSPNIDDIKQKDEPIREAGGAEALKIKMLPWSNSIFAVIPSTNPDISWNTAPVSLAGGKRAAFDELDTYLFEHRAEFKDILATNMRPAFAGATQLVPFRPVNIGMHMVSLKTSWLDDGQEYTDAMKQADNTKYMDTWVASIPKPKPRPGTEPVSSKTGSIAGFGKALATGPWTQYGCGIIGGKKPDNVPAVLDSWGAIGHYDPMMWRPTYGSLKNLLWNKTWEGPIYKIKFMNRNNLIMLFHTKFADNPGGQLAYPGSHSTTVKDWMVDNEKVGVDLYGWRSKMYPINQISELRKEIMSKENTWNNCGAQPCSMKYDGATTSVGIDGLIDSMLNKIQYYFSKNIFRGY